MKIGGRQADGTVPNNRIAQSDCTNLTVPVHKHEDATLIETLHPNRVADLQAKLRCRAAPIHRKFQ